MDRLTQLQDAIDAMARMFTNSIFYVHEKSAMVPLNDAIPIAQPKAQADPPEIFNQNMHELVTDLVKKVKEIDALIEVLPGITHTEEEQLKILQDLELENERAIEDYQQAVSEMEAVRDKVTEMLRRCCELPSHSNASAASTGRLERTP